MGEHIHKRLPKEFVEGVLEEKGFRDIRGEEGTALQAPEEVVKECYWE